MHAYKFHTICDLTPWHSADCELKKTTTVLSGQLTAAQVHPIIGLGPPIQ